jgi:hypothetical protein
VELSVPVLGRVVLEFVGLNIEGGYDSDDGRREAKVETTRAHTVCFSPLVVVFIHFAYRFFPQPPIHVLVDI